MAVDLSFLPDQPQVRKRKPEGLDLSFLPDQPEPAAPTRATAPTPKLDLSFLPDQPSAPNPAAEPRPSFADRVATGILGATEAAPALPVQNLPAFAPPVAPALSRGKVVYNQSLDAYLAGDQEKAFALAKDALRIEPDLVEAKRMTERIKPIQGHANEISTDTYNKALDAYLANDKEQALTLAHKALIQDRRNTEALRMVERLTQAVGLTTPPPVAAPPPMPGREGQIIYPPVSTAGEMVRGIPKAWLDLQFPNPTDAAAALAYEGAGAVRGVSLGYVDPTPLVEKVPMFRDAPISKGAAEMAGGFVGAMAPISTISRVVQAATTPIKAFQAVRPWLMTLFQAGATGGLYGAARKPEENQTRAMNAANDAATFIAFTGAFQGVARIMNKTILVPDVKKAEIFEKSKEAGIDAYAKGGTKADARDVFLKTLEQESDAAVKSVKAGTPGTAVQPKGFTEPATEVHIPTAFSRGLSRIMDRVRRPAVGGGKTAKPFDVGFGPGPEPLGGSSRPGPVPDQGAAGSGFVPLAKTPPRPSEVPIAPVRMLRPNFPVPSRFRIPTAAVRARAEMIHHDAMQEREAKLSPLEQFVVENGGIATYKPNPVTGKIEEAEEYRDVPVRLRGGTPADSMAQQAADANLLPPGASGDDLREAIKRFQKRGPVPRIQDFYQDAKRELENEYEEYGPPSRRPERHIRQPEPMPFESRGEYNAGPPEQPIEGMLSRDAATQGPARAVFRGWQDRAPFDTPVAIYNILGDHPKARSTVGANTLKSMGLEIPPTPTFEEWKAGGSRVQESPAAYGADGPVWYSQLQKTIEEKMPNAAPAQMVRNLVDPAKGSVKAEEVEWSGINEFLAGKDKVTKAELLEFLKSNEVQIKEVAKDAKLIKWVHLSGGIWRAEINGRTLEIKKFYAKNGLEKFREVIDGRSVDERDLFDDARSDLEMEFSGDKSQPKFSKYQLPGGENYREVLLTLAPEKKSLNYSSPEALLSSAIEQSKMKDNPVFKSSHFDEPNILAHVRMNDRLAFDSPPPTVKSEGDKAGADSLAADAKLLSDVVESPAFRKEGLSGLDVEARNSVISGMIRSVRDDEILRGIVPLIPVNVMDNLVRAKLSPEEFFSDKAMLSDSLSLNPDATVKLSKGAVSGLIRSVASLTAKRAASAANRAGVPDTNIPAPSTGNLHGGKRILFIEEIQSDWAQGLRAGKDHPNMPFKKTWHELALKRMLRYAVDNGYDGIAWTTGEQQAERYDLSKQVQSIIYKKNADGTFKVSAVRGGEGIPLGDGISAEKLSDVVGKDVARKINAGDGSKTEVQNDTVKWNSLSGLDLKVGGEGMRGFYDQIIPAFLNKYTKKWGGRVGETTFQTAGPNEQELRRAEDTGDSAEIGRALSKLGPGKMKTVHSLDITPAMRTSVSQGQPLFETRAGYSGGGKLGTSDLGTRPAAEGVAPSGDPSLDNPIIRPSSVEVKGNEGQGGVAETQMGLFGGNEPGRAVTKKPKPVPEGQGTLFGGQAQPKFNVPKSAFTPEQIAQQTPAVQKLLATEEGKHQVPQDPLPRAIQESVVIKDLVEIGQLPAHKMRIEAPEDVAAIFHQIKTSKVEKLYALALDANNNVIAADLVAIGVVDSAITTPRDFLSGAFAMGAKTVIPIHNHPSLNPKPSPQDVALTRLLARHAKEVGMVLPYHIVIDGDKFGYIHGEDTSSQAEGEVSILPLSAAPKTEPGFIRVKEAKQTNFEGRPVALNSPVMVANFAGSLTGSKKAAVGMAMNAQNEPVGVWHLGEKFPSSPMAFGAMLGKMILRHNAVGLLLTSETLPDQSYMRIVRAGIRSWGAELLDFVAWDGDRVTSAVGKNLIPKAGLGSSSTGVSDSGVSEGDAPYLPGYTPSQNPAEEAPKHRMEDTTEEGFYTDEPALPAETGTGAFSRFIGVGKNSNKFPPPEMRTALLNPESKFHDLGFWDEGTLSTLAPLRAVEIMDGKRYGMMKDNFLLPIQKSDKSFQWELKEELKGIDEVFKGMTKAEKQTVFDVIEQKGTSTGLKVDTAVAYLKDKYETLLDRLNAVRAKIGKDPIKKRTNYITHFQEMSILQDIIRNFGFRVGNASVTDITDVPASMLSISDFTKANSPYFKFAKQRIGEITERDAEKAYRIYIEPALRSIHMSRSIKNARDILEWKVVIASEYEGSDPTSVSAFAIRYPIAYKYFTRYLNRLTGKRDAWDKELPGLAFVAGFTNKLFSAGSIAGNIGTVVTQMASFRNTAAETGPWALKGQALIMTPTWSKFFQKNSRIAMGRSYEPSYQNERYIGSKVVSGTLDKISQAASIPVSMMDSLMVGGAFLSGYFQAKGAGYTEAESIRHGDDVAERTQASANLVDRPPANQGKIKTMLGQFQTFIFNEYSQWKYDFLKQAFKGEKTYQGYGSGLGGMKQGKGRGFERFMYYALGTLALGAIYDALGLPNPFRQEGATVPFGDDNSAASKVWQHVVNQIPYISSVRFGGSPAVKGVLQGMAYIQGNEQQKKQALRKLASVGVRVVPMGGQISKTAGAWRLAANEKDTWKAFKLLAFGKYMAKQNAGTKTPTGRTVRPRPAGSRRVASPRTARPRVAR